MIRLRALVFRSLKNAYFFTIYCIDIYKFSFQTRPVTVSCTVIRNKRFEYKTGNMTHALTSNNGNSNIQKNNW